jgi:hypothetical protein
MPDKTTSIRQVETVSYVILDMSNLTSAKKKPHADIVCVAQGLDTLPWGRSVSARIDDRKDREGLSTPLAKLSVTRIAKQDINIKIKRA